MNMIEELRNNIRLWNKAYRTGKPIVSDSKFDTAKKYLEKLKNIIYKLNYNLYISENL